ncbi:hypothetical protein SAMN06269185_1576 [Natronoarchaeum philippinense]|uniref:DUF192 domain-containing protein n=1 Tax=Natronoarchaeum philippinense TaxID=558529 RepID=A0A285NS00_NATPI|nr:DUF192 domain-containing protein [Natronoarchaeum philippinense]SNZ12255.1 hypothetical protein SAMN06269185_1576 [Natronoarchaeum philippinense]
MADTRATAAVGSLVVVLLLGALAVQAGYVPTPWADQYGEATVTIADEDGERLAVVQAEVADTRHERYTGLSEHTSLEPGRGMLFVYNEADDRTYVMRNMSFGIDIVYVDADNRITEIHEARAPGPNENGESMQYPGYGQYVLEVPKGYMAEHNVTEGDRITIEYNE